MYAGGTFEPARQRIATWPLAAVAATAGLVLTRKAPHARITGHATLDSVRLDGYEEMPPHEMAEAGPLGAAFSAQTTTAE